jgi:hypothetical protein
MNLLIDFCSGYTILHSHQQKEFHIPRILARTVFFFFFFLILAVLIGIW